MSIKSKLDKTKKKLKKTKSKLKSLKEKNKDLLKKIKVSEVVTKEPKLAKENDSILSDQLSKNINAKEAIALFQSINEVETIRNFTKGDKRPSVVQRAKSRINALTKG